MLDQRARQKAGERAGHIEKGEAEDRYQSSWQRARGSPESKRQGRREKEEVRAEGRAEGWIQRRARET
jgi:hypothetical protein